MTMVKSHEKKMSKLFSCDGHSEGKCRRNLNFEKMDAASYTGKNDGTLLLRGIFKEYLKQNIITAGLRNTTNAHSVVICRLIKKINNVDKNISKRKS